MSLVIPQRTLPIHSITLSIDDVKRIFSRLENYVHEQGEKEIAALVKPAELADEAWKEQKARLKQDAFRVTVTIEGSNGDSFHGDSSELFTSPNRPEVVSKIYMTNTTAYRGVTRNGPMNSFELMLDFSKPPLLDGNSLVSSPTLNVSNLSITADTDAWIASITDAVFGIISTRKNQRSILHRAFVYDFGLLLVGLPLAFYVSWKMSDFVQAQFGNINNVLAAAAYVYLMLFTIWCYRILFGYSKWAFPTVELIENEGPARKHRLFWWTIVVGLIGKVIWDVFGKYFVASV